VAVSGGIVCPRDRATHPMGPFLSAILAAFLSTIALDQPASSESVDRATPTMLAFAIVAFAWVTSRMHRSPPEQGGMRQPPWARPFDLAMFALLLFGTDWTTVAGEASLNLPLLRQVLTLAPYFLAALARVDAAFPAPRENEDDHAAARTRIVAFHARLLLIPIAPLLVIETIHDILRLVPSARLLLDAYPVLEYGAITALFVLVMLLMPWILGWLLRSRPLPDGPVRASLEADLRRQGVRIGGIEEVDTYGLVANAAYLGLSTRLGRIFISDALLQAMPADEIRAVFAHEVAHGTRRHLVWFLVFFSALPLCGYVTEDFVGEAAIRGVVGADASALAVKVIAQWAQALALGLPMICGMIFFFVGISRQFEVEADLVGAKTIADPELFSRALLRVGAIAGKPLDRHGLRHYGIAARTEIVRGCAVDPATDARWRGRIRGAKIVIAVLCILVAAGVAWKLPPDLEVGHAKALRLAGDSSTNPEALRSAVAHARAALPYRVVRNEAALLGVDSLITLADQALERGDFDEARRIAAEVEADWPAGEPRCDWNRRNLALELAAIDPGRDLESLQAEIKDVQDRLQDLLTVIRRNESSDTCERDLRFMAAAAGTDGGKLAYDPDSSASARLLAIARGANLGSSESRESARALADWSGDAAWRRVVLGRALGGRSPREALDGLVAAETRRASR
jgi:Zn-dependent protease with chaperone function